MTVRNLNYIQIKIQLKLEFCSIKAVEYVQTWHLMIIIGYDIVQISDL
jgi:hypothetical protein